jgi:hypothetical protein
MTTDIRPDNGDGITIQVQDASRVLEFHGHLLSEISTETHDGPRWLEMDLYKVDDGRYVLHLVGRSVVYHTHRSSCNRGIPRHITDTDWPADAEPCKVCSPDYWRGIGPEAEFDLEMDRHTSYVCATADDVVTQLRESSRHQRSPSTLSAPAQRLLDAAALIDSDIAKSITVVEKI